MIPAIGTLLYYTFHLLYLGHPSDTLSRLWTTYGLAHGLNEHRRSPSPGDADAEKSEPDSKNKKRGRDDDDYGDDRDDDRQRQRVQDAWKRFDESMRESYKAIGFIAALIATGIGSLLSIESYRSSSTAQTFLLTGLTASVLSAAGCISLLSTVFPDAAFIERSWRASGIVFVLSLSGPQAWLSVALWCFQIALLAIVWGGAEAAAAGVAGTESVAKGARVLVTFCIALRLVVKLGARWYSSKLLHSRTEFVLRFVGLGQGMSDYMANLNDDTIKEWKRYLQSLEEGEVYHPSPGLSISDRLFGAARWGAPAEAPHPTVEPSATKLPEVAAIQGLRGGDSGGQTADNSMSMFNPSAEDRLFIENILGVDDRQLEARERQLRELEEKIASMSIPKRFFRRKLFRKRGSKRPVNETAEEEEEGEEEEEEGEGGNYVGIDMGMSPHDVLVGTELPAEPAGGPQPPTLEEVLSGDPDSDADDPSRMYPRYAKGKGAEMKGEQAV